MSKRGGLSVESADSSSNVSKDSDELHPLRWEHARSRDIDWEKKDLLAVIYWLRQILGLIFGIVFGTLPLTGLPAIMLFGSINAALLFVYYTKFLQIDDEDEKYGRWDLLSEGMGTSVGLFLVTWICIYSLPY